ncbi:MAG TPA: prolipoprotein diacylglyceryl transferase [Gemmatimonadaceae bacterium]|nr:prolipoprotein diacylglyceryl transferase [Gemmatimonadaceae bacterium]
MADSFVWNIDPVLLRIGPLSVRYYGICFGLALVTGFAIWYTRVQRFGESRAFAEDFLFFGVPGVIIGGRLGYCLFYAPKVFLAHPWRIFAIWEGGIVSHGVAIGLAAALWAFSRRHRVTVLRLGDYFVPAAALAVGWIRVGNFFNSEVIGQPASVPWAVVFARHDLRPRHPAQLYDLLIGPITWLVLHALEKRNIRPVGSGLIAGTFLTCYFGVRIFVEQYKDFYLEQVRALPPFSSIEHWLGVPVHTGQWLSIVPLVAGTCLIARALRLPHAPAIPRPITETP